MSEADVHFEFYRHLQNAVDADPQRNGLTFGDVRPEYGEDMDGFADIVLFESDGSPAVVIEAKAPNGSSRSRREIDPYAPKVIRQAFRYAGEIGAPYFCTFNGDRLVVFDAYEDLVARATNYQPDATILGVQVQAMVDLDEGTETIVGVNRDPQFGPLVLFGLGGIFVEVLEDTTLRVAPVSEPEAREMIDEVKAAPLLRGARGRTPADVEGVIETIQRLSQLVTDFPAILELDINPLVAGPDGVRAVDVRLTVDTDQL